MLILRLQGAVDAYGKAGCPALPPALYHPIIDAIKGGSVMYIYAGTAD